MKIKKLILLTLITFSLFFTPHAIFAAATATAVPAVPSVPAIITNIMTAFITIGGSLVVISWVIAGILYLMAMGNPGKMDTAKKAVVGAIAGTILILLATVAEATIKALLGI